MIPKYVYNSSQTTLNSNISIADRLYKYRELLYYDLCNKIKHLDNRKKELINEYKKSVIEIDNEIKKQKVKNDTKRREFI